MNKPLFSVLSMTLWGLSACVQPQQVDLIEREQRRLRNDTTSVQTEVESMRSALADTRANLQQLQREFGALKERIEETRYQVGRQIGQTSREGDQRIKDLESRVVKMQDLESRVVKMQDLESRVMMLAEALKSQEAQLKLREDETKQLRETLQASQSAAPAAESADIRAESWAGETEALKRDYEIAWSALEKKDYQLAIRRFKDFLKRYPKSNLADNAQYWIGESHYALREFDRAILEFDAVRRKYPQGEKVPAALLKQGYSFAELGEKVNARLILQEVIEKYPQSPEAIRAKQKLKTLES